MILEKIIDSSYVLSSHIKCNTCTRAFIYIYTQEKQNHEKIIFSNSRFFLDEGRQVGGMFLASAAHVVLPHDPRVAQIIIPRSEGKWATRGATGVSSENSSVVPGEEDKIVAT